jgi:hypothetical protein
MGARLFRNFVCGCPAVLGAIFQQFNLKQFMVRQALVDSAYQGRGDTLLAYQHNSLQVMPQSPQMPDLFSGK